MLRTTVRTSPTPKLNMELTCGPEIQLLGIIDPNKLKPGSYKDIGLEYFEYLQQFRPVYPILLGTEIHLTSSLVETKIT